MPRTITPDQLDTVIKSLCNKNDTRFEKAIFVGTSSDWTSETHKSDYSIVILTNTKVIDLYDSTTGTLTDVANFSSGALDVEATQELIASVDVNPAEKAHAVGSYLILNNTVYKATQAIAIGDTLTVGTNIALQTNTVYEHIRNIYLQKLYTYANDNASWDTAPTKSSTKPVTSGGIKEAIDNAEGIIAPVEYSPSTRAYAIGNKLIYNGKLYSAKTAIAIGDTLTVGTNLTLIANSVSDWMGQKLSNYANDNNSWDSTPTANSTKPVTSGGIKTAINEVKIIKVDINSVSSLPQTVNNSKITANHVVINSVLSNPSAQLSDWTVTTAAGSVTVSGTISGTTNISIYLGVTE